MNPFARARLSSLWSTGESTAVGQSIGSSCVCALSDVQAECDCSRFVRDDIPYHVKRADEQQIERWKLERTK